MLTALKEAKSGSEAGDVIRRYVGKGTKGRLFIKEMFKKRPSWPEKIVDADAQGTAKEVLSGSIGCVVSAQIALHDFIAQNKVVRKACS